MNKLKSHFRFNKQERSGIFYLLFFIILLQVGYFFSGFFSLDAPKDTLVVDKDTQTLIDRLREAALKKDTIKIYPFNPNFITDYKGYVLGMTVEEIDRLHAFRKQNKFANTPKEFQKITQVSDSMLDAISPFFKFPEWTKSSKRSAAGSRRYPPKSDSKNGIKDSSPLASDQRMREEGTEVAGTADLNTATAEDLKVIRGIGEKLSARIVKFRNMLGGFVVDEQLYEVYGLDPEVAERALKRFKVHQTPDIQKIDLNTASAEEISKLAYIQKHVAERIVEYRNGNGGVISLEELKNIEGFPSENIDRIALYLSKN